MKAFLALVAAFIILVAISAILPRIANPEQYAEAQKQAEAEKEARKVITPATREPGRIATVFTNRGQFRFVLYEKDMPVTCSNFINLVGRGFYKNMKFHRVEPWVIQTGDPTGTGTGGSGKYIKLETKPGLTYDTAYMVGMARSQDPDSASSQFFINRKPASQLSAPGVPGYACFGQVISGKDVIDKIKKGDALNKITISKPTPEDMKIIQMEQMKLPPLRPNPFMPGPGTKTSSR